MPALLAVAACGADEPRGTADEVPVTMDGAIAPAPGVYPFQGAWAANAAACEADDERTIITTRTMIGDGRSCDIGGVGDGPGGTYLIATDCEEAGEGEVAATVEGDTLTLSRSGEAERLRRCEPSASGE